MLKLTHVLIFHLVRYNSLSALADVLGALSEHRSHIPYRNTRLTHMLQDTIGEYAFAMLELVIVIHLTLFISFSQLRDRL